MFKELLNFEYKRSAVQAIGFYIFYFIIGIILSAVLAGLIIICLVKMGLVTDTQTSANVGRVIGACCAIIYYFALSSIIILRKKLYTSVSAILLLLLTIVAAVLMGGLLGCICPAILSTFQPKTN